MSQKPISPRPNSLAARDAAFHFHTSRQHHSGCDSHAGKKVARVREKTKRFLRGGPCAAPHFFGELATAGT